MDTKKDSAISDVPTFKVARVGKDRKRKGGALSFLRGGGARGSFSGATGGAGAGAGGSGAAGAFASTFVKSMLSIALASGIGAAAVGAGYMGMFGEREQKAAKKPEVFSNKGDVKIEGDTSNLPGSANTIPNSMGYVTGSADGLTPEERAKKAAEAAEAQRLADEEAKKKAEAEDAAAKANAAVDPNALLAAAQKDGGKNDKANGFGKKFGQLSSSTGGSALAGGAGMAGGVGRSFGGMGSITKGKNGSLSGVGSTARPTTKASASSKVAKSNVKGFARKQLANANALSRRGMTASKGETAAYDASSAFDNNQGAGTIISGAGIGKGAKPAGEGDGSANPNTTSQPVGNAGQVDCGANNYQAADGTCQPIPTQDGKKDDPNEWMYKTGMAILATITALAIVAALTYSMDWLFGSGVAAREAIGAIMVVLAGILILLGLAMMLATGDKIAGGMFALTGAYIEYMAFTTPASASMSLGLAVSFMVPVILGGVAAAGSHKTEASGQ